MLFVLLLKNREVRTNNNSDNKPKKCLGSVDKERGEGRGGGGEGMCDKKR